MLSKIKKNWGRILAATLIACFGFANLSLAQSGGTRDIPSGMSESMGRSMQEAQSNLGPESPTSTSFDLSDNLNINEQGNYQAPFCTDPDNCNPVANFLLRIVNFLALSIATVAFVTVIIGGFMILTSAGNETQMNKGKEVLTYAIIGLVISLSAYYIVSFVQGLLFDVR